MKPFLLVPPTRWLIAFWFCLNAAAALQCRAQGIVTFVFEGPPAQPPGSAYFVQEYFEGGMWFRPLGVVEPGNGFARTGLGVAELPQNGSAYVQTLLGDSLVFSFTNGDLFDLLSVDLAEYSTVVPDAATVRFIGYRPDGSTITRNLTTDGVIDGTGPFADFQTFAFTGFTGLSHVEVPGFGWSLDNLRVIPVPEPAMGALLFVGGVAVWACRPRQGPTSKTRHTHTPACLLTNLPGGTLAETLPFCPPLPLPQEFRPNTPSLSYWPGRFNPNA